MNPLEHPHTSSERPSPEELPKVPSPVPSGELPHAHSYAYPISDTPKKTYHPKRFMIALSIFVGICILAVATMVAIALLSRDSAHKTATQSNSQKTVSEKTLSAKTAIDHVKEYFKGDQVAKSSLDTPVLATGKAFYTVIPDVTVLSSVAGEVTAAQSGAQLASIVHSLEGDDFSKRVTSDGSGTTNYLADFTRKETYCQVSITKPADTKANQWFEVRCLDMATYAEYAEAQKPLVDQYTPLTATSVQYGFVGKPILVPSKTANYWLVDLEVSIVVDDRMTSAGKYAQFYRSPDGLWHYFRDRDSATVLGCDVYKSDELRFAYAGQPCRDTKKNGANAVVEPPKQ